MSIGIQLTVQNNRLMTAESNADGRFRIAFSELNEIRNISESEVCAAILRDLPQETLWQMLEENVLPSFLLEEIENELIPRFFIEPDIIP